MLHLSTQSKHDTHTLNNANDLTTLFLSLHRLSTLFSSSSNVSIKAQIAEKTVFFSTSEKPTIREITWHEAPRNAESCSFFLQHRILFFYVRRRQTQQNPELCAERRKKNSPQERNLKIRVEKLRWQTQLHGQFFICSAETVSVDLSRGLS